MALLMSVCRLALQAVTDDDAAPYQPGPTKRKRLLVLPALPAAQQPCGSDAVLPALTLPASAISGSAPHVQNGVTMPAAKGEQPLPSTTPLAKQSQRQLRTPFARQAAWPVAASACKTLQVSELPAPAFREPPLQEMSPPPTRAQCVQAMQHGLVPEPGPLPVHAGVPPVRNSMVTPTEVGQTPPAGPASAVSAPPVEQTDRRTARTSGIEVAASEQVSADNAVCAVPLAAEGVQRDCSSRSASAPAAALSAAVPAADDVDALVIDDDIPPGPTSTGAAEASPGTCNHATGPSAAAVAYGPSPRQIASPRGDGRPMLQHSKGQRPKVRQRQASIVTLLIRPRFRTRCNLRSAPA